MISYVYLQLAHPDLSQSRYIQNCHAFTSTYMPLASPLFSLPFIYLHLLLLYAITCVIMSMDNFLGHLGPSRTGSPNLKTENLH